MTEDDLKAIEVRAKAEGTATWDEKFIIHARRDIPALTAALREAWEENERLQIDHSHEMHALEAHSHD